MIIDKVLEQQFFQQELYLCSGLSMFGTGFVGIRCEMRAGRSGKVSSLSCINDANISSYVVANAGEYNNCSLGSYGSFADGVKILGRHDYNRITTSTCTVKVPVSSRVFAGFKGKKEWINLNHTIIGHDVWIGSNVQIKNGVIIGHGAVIGAGSVVTKNVPPYAIVGGVPAKIIRMRFPESDIERLLKSEWYTYDWNNIEVEWGDMHTCLEQMEELISQGAVPKLGKGFVCQFNANNTVTLTPAEWSIERQLQSMFGTSNMSKIFEDPTVKEHTMR